jgi:hypothetical protein
MEVLRQYFPDDIAQFICEKKDKSEHYDMLDSCHEQIKVQSFIDEYQEVQEMSEEQGFVIEQQDAALKDYFPDLQKCLHILAKCRCCNAHYIYKPRNVKEIETCMYRVCCSPVHEKKEKQCSCACRHIARRLVRAHTYTALEYIEDDRYMLHAKYIENYNRIKTTNQKIHEYMNQRRMILEEISLEVDDAGRLNALCSEHCELLDSILAMKMNIDKYNQKHEENMFELKQHICEYKDVYTQEDVLFLKKVSP